ncbi:hypothetical protein AM1_A0086 (plasmid) [Acaryochloris marina MBIC11017]|uniref:Uncharacterized protein n=1 Tax=Acaryochloris marina (strain MBIC 11017) TaxID=329726 RepID=A8ZK95_ACAM1|nr:hypothetical protein AM1_A0086 [Acaryochloris marina MBIC11017]
MTTFNQTIPDPILQLRHQVLRTELSISEVVFPKTKTPRMAVSITVMIGSKQICESLGLSNLELN